MLTDREFLIWIHERMVHVYKESELVDFLHRFRAIISSIPPKQRTPGFLGKNSLEELKNDLQS